MYGGREALSAAEANQMDPTKGPPLLASPGNESIPLGPPADDNVTQGSRLLIRDAATTWWWPSHASGTRATAVHERPIVDGVRYGRHYPVRMVRRNRRRRNRIDHWRPVQRTCARRWAAHGGMTVLSVDAPTSMVWGEPGGDHLGVAARRNRNRWNQTRHPRPVTLPVVLTVDRVLAAGRVRRHLDDAQDAPEPA